MLLVSVEDFRSANGLGSTEAMLTKIKQAVTKASAVLAESLRNSFDRVVDAEATYRVNVPPYHQVDGGFYLKLPQGFVTVSSVGGSDSLKDSYTTIDAEDYIVSEEAGLVFFEEFEYAYIKITYSAGFEVDVDSETYQGAPTWLTNEATDVARRIYAHYCETPKERAPKPDFGIRSTVGSKIRFFPWAREAING